MKLALCMQPLYGLGLDRALATVAELGITAIELPVDARSPLVDLDHLLAGGARELRSRLRAHGLTISAVSNHQEGQLLLGPHHSDTDAIFAGTAAEKAEYARTRLKRSAELANLLEVGLLIGFVGCEDYTRYFPWPDPSGWDKMRPQVVERVAAVLDDCDRLGVNFGHEPHPKQIVYDIETAHEVLGWLGGHRRFGFNLDPANLLLAGVDPVVFVAELGDRIWHVHGKDGEVVPHNIRRSGLLAHGDWARKDRGFRFRIPGWGDVPWKRLVTELQLAGYRGHIAIENEDPVFAPLDGIRKAIAALRPLLPDGEPEARWW